jgi:phosphonate transport system substrate-binding protein
VNSPTAYLTTLPAELRAAIRSAVLELPAKEPALFERLYDGKQRPWEPVDNAAYQPIIALNRFVDGLRRQRG